MSKSRNNHYVPQWYQEGFLETGSDTLAYLNINPDRKVLDDGRVITKRSLFNWHPSRTFQQRDLYSTFFGTSVNDEIERRLFGDMDTTGSRAVKAFAGTDINEWIRHFQALFEYIDIQKIRTPKGLDWLRTQYPDLTQNELMAEMQGIRMMHCTIWFEGVREIVSAENADVKFLVTDHPVTIYNHAIPPDIKGYTYPNDPSIALKASQTIFPLNSAFCLILTNLEYARDPSALPLEKRTFARNYRETMTRADALIRKRKLSNQEVTRINYVLKARARRYVAAGRKEWLYPERDVAESWSEMRNTFLPPENELWNFGGQLFAQYTDGRVHYQDEFGRTEEQRDFLKKNLPTNPLQPDDICGCGTGRLYKQCCESKPVALRSTWNELSIRERNIGLYNGIANVLGVTEQKDWVSVRRDLTDEQISKIYHLYEALWPRETDLFALLPKPDGTARAVYSGFIHPTSITDFALGASLYFGELIVAHPFLHAGTVRKEFNPVENPNLYRHEFLKTVLFFLTAMPLVENGLINLVPDPCNFDVHLQQQMMNMARLRTAQMEVDPEMEQRVRELAVQDQQRSLASMPRNALRSTLLAARPELDMVAIEREINHIEQLKELDPLAILQKDSGAGVEKRQQFNMMHVAPNFEMAMYLAQVTGSNIVTDSFHRWKEIWKAVRRRTGKAEIELVALVKEIEKTIFAFPQKVNDIEACSLDKAFGAYPALMRDILSYLSRDSHGPSRKTQLVDRFDKTHTRAQAVLNKAHIHVRRARISCAIPVGGIQDNTVNRLLLMSSSETHLPSVPAAFFIKELAGK